MPSARARSHLRARAIGLWLLCDAAVRGLGIALLPVMVARHLLESGVLQQVLEGVVEADGQIAVVYPEREFVPPQVREFVAAVVAWAAEELPKGLLPGFGDGGAAGWAAASPAHQAEIDRETARQVALKRSAAQRPEVPRESRYG